MIKNDVNDKLSEEFLVSIKDIKKDKEKYSESVKGLYKKYLNFDSEFLKNMPYNEIEDFFVHPRIKDYSKVCILGMLFIDEWLEGYKEDENFYKLEKGVFILSDIYLSDKEAKLDYYVDYLINGCDELIAYEIPVGMKFKILEVYFKVDDLIKVDDMAFEILEEDNSFKDKIVDIYNKILSLNEEVLYKNNITKEEIKDALEEIKKF